MPYFFCGPRFTTKFLVADIQLDTSLSSDKADAFLEKQILALFPLGHRVYRMAASLNNQEIKNELSGEKIKDLIQKRSHSMFNVQSVLHFSIFGFIVKSHIKCGKALFLALEMLRMFIHLLEDKE